MANKLMTALTAIAVAFQASATWDAISFGSKPNARQAASSASETPEIERLRAKVRELEETIRKLADNTGPKLKETPKAKPKKTAVYLGPVYYPRHWTAGHWTWPGNLRDHLINVHGVDPVSVKAASPEQLMRWHDYTHEYPTHWARRKAGLSTTAKPSRTTIQYCPT